MFGDDLIIGHTINKMDEKGRIFIPSFTKVEKSDKLIIQKTTFQDDIALRLCAYQQYLTIIERLQKLRNNSTSIEEYEKFTREINNIFYILDSLIEIDSQKRATIPKRLLNELEWEPNSEYKIDGLGDSIINRQKNK